MALRRLLISSDPWFSSECLAMPVCRKILSLACVDAPRALKASRIDRHVELSKVLVTNENSRIMRMIIGTTLAQLTLPIMMIFGL